MPRMFQLPRVLQRNVVGRESAKATLAQVEGMTATANPDSTGKTARKVSRYTPFTLLRAPVRNIFNTILRPFSSYGGVGMNWG
jgi:hypothetical protein